MMKRDLDEMKSQTNYIKVWSQRTIKVEAGVQHTDKKNKSEHTGDLLVTDV